MNEQALYEKWLEYPNLDDAAREELLRIQGDEKEIEDRFYKNLEFGTGGLRGIMGAGTNRMNRYTVRKATEGLAAYIIRQGKADQGVVISYDSRNGSWEFSREAAACFCANGIRVYRFSALRPTPELSFAVRWLGCAAGVMITASHNPAVYNGYKVYWEDGAQITAPRDRAIIEMVNGAEEGKTMDLSEAESMGLYRELGGEVDDAYLGEVKKLVLRPDILEEMAEKLKIVYTPLHGTGLLPVTRILKELGFDRVAVVKEQEMPDGSFPTVRFPNPEDPAAFSMALRLAEKEGADVVMATDPDADRLGVYVKDRRGEYRRLNGNMTGILLCDYILSQRKALGTLPENGVVVKTIVTTNMIVPIAASYGVSVVEVLTGFKYIGEKIKEFTESKEYEYVFGFEESYGCLTGTYARDKDAVSAAAALCEAAACCKKRGITLWERLMELYEAYGHYEEYLKTESFEGPEGFGFMSAMMKEMREKPPKEVNGRRVKRIRDYLTGIITDVETGETEASGLPRSDVLYFELEDDAWFCMRPSGTEPKIKYYGGEVKREQISRCSGDFCEGTGFVK